MLGEIPIDNKCVVERADRDEKGLGPMFHLEVTCTQQSRTYYMLTAEQEQRDLHREHGLHLAGSYRSFLHVPGDKDKERIRKPVRRSTRIVLGSTSRITLRRLREFKRQNPS